MAKMPYKQVTKLRSLLLSDVTVRGKCQMGHNVGCVMSKRGGNIPVENPERINATAEDKEVFGLRSRVGSSTVG